MILTDQLQGLGFEIRVDRARGDDPPFHCVSTAKFVLLSLFTFGLYQLVWFYKNWKLVKSRTDAEFSPLARAFFSPLFCYAFARTVNSAAESLRLGRVWPGAIAILYWLIITLQRLPDPYWLICLFSFVPLLTVVRQIRRIHEVLRPGSVVVDGWGGWSYVSLAAGVLVTAIAVLSFSMVPSHVLKQSEIPSSYQRTLVEAGILEPDEQIRFFYSLGLFSILEEGNILTDERVVSYETWEAGLLVSSAAYPDIQDVDVEYAKGVLDDTTLTISTVGGDQFLLFLSNEKGRDREFLSALEDRIPTSRDR